MKRPFSKEVTPEMTHIPGFFLILVMGGIHRIIYIVCSRNPYGCGHDYWLVLVATSCYAGVVEYFLSHTGQINLAKCFTIAQFVDSKPIGFEWKVLNPLSRYSLVERGQIL